MSGFEEIIFDGGEGQCERFIRRVRKAAFSQGKLEDSKWVAMFASTCFEGKALRWYSGLEQATKMDWHLMEPALLAEFSGPVLSAKVPEDPVPVDQETSIPTPAAAPPPPPVTGEQPSSRASSPVSYEPTPASAPPSGSRPPPPAYPEPSPQATSPPPPPPRHTASTPSSQSGSRFRPPPRHPSAPGSSSSSGGPSLYGSYIPTSTPAAAPPPPPRRNQEPGSRPTEAAEEPPLSTDQTNPFERERRPYATSSGFTQPNPNPIPNSPPDNPNVAYFVAPGGTAYQNSTQYASAADNSSTTPTSNPPPPSNTNYSGNPEPQSETPSQTSPPPPPPPRRDPRPPPPPPRQTPSYTTQPPPQYPNSGFTQAGVPSQYTGVPPQYTGAGVPPQYTGGPGPGVYPQYTGGPPPGPQQQYNPGYAAPPPQGYWAPPNTARRGRIRVIDDSGAVYYVRQSLNWFGGYKRTSRIGEAAIVTWDPANAPGQLTLVNPLKNLQWIGITWSSVSTGASGVLGKGSKDHADMVALGPGMVSSSSAVGTSEAALWYLNPDMSLEARLPGPQGVLYTLDVAVGSGTKWVWLVSDFETFSLSNVGQIKSRLAFEPL